MHNSVTRLQTSFGFFTTCAFFLAATIAVLSLLPFPAPASAPTASITVRDVQVVKGRAHYYSPKKEEYAQIRFDLSANLSSLFSWNTKQVFVYVTANYPGGAEGEVSEAIIWDQIITAPQTPFAFQNLKANYWDTRFNKNTKTSRSKAKKTTTKGARGKALQKNGHPGIISLKNQKAKYQLTDPSGKLSERSNVTLQVSWNVQPWIGALVWDKGYLGSRVGAWESDKNGRSEVFGFPVLKGARSATAKEHGSSATPGGGGPPPVIEI